VERRGRPRADNILDNAVMAGLAGKYIPAAGRAADAASRQRFAAVPSAREVVLRNEHVPAPAGPGGQKPYPFSAVVVGSAVWQLGVQRFREWHYLRGRARREADWLVFKEEEFKFVHPGPFASAYPSEAEGKAAFRAQLGVRCTSCSEDQAQARAFKAWRARRAKSKKGEKKH